MKNTLTLFLFFLLNLGYAQDSFVIQNVRLFNGETVIENASVLIENGKIAEISSEKLTNKNVIDGKGKTLLPGMTNAHVHVWSPMSLQEAAKAGVLNVLDMHAVEMMIPQMKMLRGSTNHADYYCAGAAATVPKGHGTQYGFPTPTLTKPEEAKEFVTGRVKSGADYIKIIKEPWKATLDSATVASLVKEAHLQNKKVVVHVSRNTNALEVIRSGADGLVHIWRDSVMKNYQIDALKKHKFFIVPTMIVRKLSKENLDKKGVKAAHITVEELKSEVKKMYDLGIPILAGTDPPNFQLNYGTDLFKEMELLQEAGIPTTDVLKSATSLPAIHFNLKEKGFIKKGYRADLVLVEGNPTKNIADIANKKRVWKLGKEVQ